ncbi:hypothetical protein [Engelhardtia mirabilis]|uniref:FG-GAP repeat protein n=1 Tax=Engelhardtia mirabilis TaxID=2528011 RepID=A0A518BIK2_9BACT|nr:hypothetical protein Pla133_18850 [Planctomycetes bacterium Pla133]QDV01135.1 hypothetical protein Pla86_18840 [Planctomycetes bacterium Pla86]
MIALIVLTATALQIDTPCASASLEAETPIAGAMYGIELESLDDGRVFVTTLKNIGGGVGGGSVEVLKPGGGGLGSSLLQTLPTVPSYSGPENFGLALDYSDGLLAIGAPGYNPDPDGIGTKPGQGAVYLYEVSGSEFVERIKMLSPIEFGQNAHDSFGIDVAIDGDCLVVGSSGRPVACSTGGVCDNAGQVFVYDVSDPGNPAFIQALNAPFVDDDGRFGAAVDVEALSGGGERLAVGAFYANNGGVARSGAVYVFERTGGLFSSAAVKITQSPPVAHATFGKCLDLEGDLLVVGAPSVSVDPTIEGAAYLFQESGGSGWVEIGALTPSLGFAGDQFGVSLDFDDDRILIGSPGPPPPDSSAVAGSAYLFVKPHAGWSSGSETAVMLPTAPSLSAGERWGHAVALDRFSGYVGRTGAKPNGIVDAGSAQAFVIGGLKLHSCPSTIVLGNGGTQVQFIDFDDEMAGDVYIALYSSEVKEVGLGGDPQGLQLPIGVGDPWFGASLSGAGDPPFVGSLGLLDAAGDGNASLFTQALNPVPLPLVGVELFTAVLSIDLSAGVVDISNATRVRLN